MKRNIGSLPDVYWVELHYNPEAWANGGPPEVYKFQCIGGTWGAKRWAVHAIWANRPMPVGDKLSLRRLRELINTSLGHQTEREITTWHISCLAWEEP